MERVITLSEEEGIATRGDPTQAARASMKYGAQGQVAIGTKIELMPRVNAWFNGACEKVLFRTWPRPPPYPHPNPNPNPNLNPNPDKVLFPHMASLFPSLIRLGLG